MTFHLDSHTTTDVKPDMLSCVQTRNGIPDDRYKICGIAHVHTNKKDDIFHAKTTRANLYICILEWGKGLVKNQDRTRSELTQP